jgi:hypothetical protein
MRKQFLSESPKGKDHSEEIRVDGEIILEWILGKQGGKVLTASIWFRTGISVELS